MPRAAIVTILGLVVPNRDRALHLSVTSLVWTFVLAILAIPSPPPPIDHGSGAAQRQPRLVAARDLTMAPAHVAPLLPHPALLAACTRLQPPSFGLSSSPLPLDRPRVARTPIYLHKLVLLL